MGIDLAAFEFLLKANAEFGDFRSTLILGRQRLLVRDDAEKARFSRVLERYRPDIALDDILERNVDKLIVALGGDPYQVMDNSVYEGAEVIHDLNDPLPPELYGRFDTVIDIGTLEHVFNIATAMKSMAEAVRVGGQFLCLNIANHHLGHGFWQFSPEVFFRTFSPVHGYAPRLAELHYQGAFHPVRDPETAGRRLPIKTLGYTYVIFGARREAERPIFPDGWPVQADYIAAWRLFQIRQAEREGRPEEARACLPKRAPPPPGNPVYTLAEARFLRQSDPDSAEADALIAEAHEMAPDRPQVAEAHAAQTGRFSLGGVELLIGDPLIPEKTEEALKRGRYEFKEREIARRLLRFGDRVIELGAGMGVVSLTLARLLGAEAVRSFEANPRIIELARRNALHNDLPVTFRNEIASPRIVAGQTPYIDFFVLNSFEASSTRQVSPSQTPVSIATTPLEDEIAGHGANALVFDIEGFETEIIEKTDLSGVDKIVLEIHPKILGLDTCLDLIDRLEAQGLTMRKDLTFGDVIAFERVGDQGDLSGAALFRTLHEMEQAAGTQDWAEAAKIAQSVEAQSADNAYMQFRLSQIEHALGQDGLARALRAAELGSEDFLLFGHLAALHLRAGDGAGAQAALERLECLFPNSPDIALLKDRIAVRV